MGFNVTIFLITFGVKLCQLIAAIETSYSICSLARPKRSFKSHLLSTIMANDVCVLNVQMSLSVFTKLLLRIYYKPYYKCLYNDFCSIFVSFFETFYIIFLSGFWHLMLHMNNISCYNLICLIS